MNVITTSMEAAYMNVSTFQEIIAVRVMMASCWLMMAIIVSVRKTLQISILI